MIYGFVGLLACFFYRAKITRELQSFPDNSTQLYSEEVRKEFTRKQKSAVVVSKVKYKTDTGSTFMLDHWVVISSGRMGRNLLDISTHLSHEEETQMWRSE